MEDSRGGRLDSAFSVGSAVHWPFLNYANPPATIVKQQPFGSVIANNPSLVKDGVGAFTPRNAPKPHMKNEQLTIFYAGSVNVYDDVSSHMAQAIMLMASKECKTTINVVHPTAEAPVLAPLSKRMGLTNQKAPSETTNTSMGPAAVMPRAVPQARKASLARFLEKRKERVSSIVPYSCEKKTTDSSIVLEGAPPLSKCSFADASISSNGCGSWSVDQTNSCSDSDDSPSTKLEM